VISSGLRGERALPSNNTGTPRTEAISRRRRKSSVPHRVGSPGERLRSPSRLGSQPVWESSHALASRRSPGPSSRHTHRHLWERSWDTGCRGPARSNRCHSVFRRLAEVCRSLARCPHKCSHSPPGTANPESNPSQPHLARGAVRLPCTGRTRRDCSNSSCRKCPHLGRLEARSWDPRRCTVLDPCSQLSSTGSGTYTFNADMRTCTRVARRAHASDECTDAGHAHQVRRTLFASM
jgi:hypothetical protein